VRGEADLRARFNVPALYRVVLAAGEGVFSLRVETATQERTGVRPLRGDMGEGGVGADGCGVGGHWVVSCLQIMVL